MFQIIDKISFDLFAWIRLQAQSNICPTAKMSKNERIFPQNVSHFFIMMILIWFISYSIYEKCLHLLLRRMRYGVIARRRIIDSLWCSGFALCSIIYLKVFLAQSIDSTPHLAQKLQFFELGCVLHTSFYLHRAFIEGFNHNNCLQAWKNGFFFLTIYTSLVQKLLDAAIKLLFYNATVIAIINICRLVTIVKNKSFISKGLLGIYFTIWIYTNFKIVPNFQWCNTPRVNEWLLLIFMGLWFILNIINEIYNIQASFKNSSQWVDAYLFAPPTQEMIELKNVCKKLRETANPRIPEPSDRKKIDDLWKTISCAMIMKKKVKRLREVKSDFAAKKED